MERRSKEKIQPIEIYTDGSLKKMGQQTFGGWAFIVLKDGQRLCSFTDSEYNTTNQRMELTAIWKALDFAKNIRQKGEKVIIYSDSAYAINCYQQEWYMNWMTNGWLNANKKEVANKDLWFKIVPYFENFWYTFKKVEGHSGNFWNEECDTLAQHSAEYLKTNWRGTQNL